MEPSSFADTFCLPNIPRFTLGLYENLINTAKRDFSEEHSVPESQKLCASTAIDVLQSAVSSVNYCTTARTEETYTGPNPHIDSTVDRKKLLGAMSYEVVFLDVRTVAHPTSKIQLFEITATRMLEAKVTEIFHVFAGANEVIYVDSLEASNTRGVPEEAVAPLDTAIEALVLFADCTDIVTHNSTAIKGFMHGNDAGCCLRANIWLDSIELAKICFPYLKSHKFNDLALCITGSDASENSIARIILLSNVYLCLLRALLMMDAEAVEIISRICSVEQWDLSHLFKRLSALNAKESLSDLRLGAPEQEDDLIRSFFKKTRKNMANSYDANMMSKVVNTSQGAKAPHVSPSEIGVHAFMELSGDQREFRQSQEEMAKKVYKAFRTSNNLLIEAGTGTGKTFAYLIPAIEFSIKNNKQVAISTVTNSLLDQIVYKDLPIIEKVFEKVTGIKISYVPLKGATHYFCLRSTERLIKRVIAQGGISGYSQADYCNIAMAITQIAQNDFTDTSNLAFLKDSSVPYKIKADTLYCRRQHCPYFPNLCFLHGVKSRAQKANIVITNHSLALRNLKFDNSMFSDVKYWVFDEAHALGKEALEAFSTSFNLWALEKLISKLRKENVKKQDSLSELKVRKNLDILFPNDENNALLDEGGLSEIEKIFRATCIGPDGNCLTIFSSLKIAVGEFAKSANLLCLAASEFKTIYQAQSNLANIIQLETYGNQELWINDQVRNTNEYQEVHRNSVIMLRLVNELTISLLDIYNQIQSDLMSYEEALLPNDVKNLSKLSVLCENIVAVSSGIARSLTDVYIAPKNEYTQELHFKKIGNSVSTTALSRALSTADDFKDYVYGGADSIVLTSATLSYNLSFKYLEKQLGVKSIDDFPDTETGVMGNPKIINFSSIKNNDNAEKDTVAVGCMLAPVFNYDTQMRVYVANDMPDPALFEYLDSLIRLITDLHVANKGSILTLFTNKTEMMHVYQSVQSILAKKQIDLICHTGGPITTKIKEEFIKNKSTSLFGLKSFWEGFDAPGDTLTGVIICKIPFASGHDPRSLMLKQMKRDSFNSILMPDATIQLKQGAGRLLRNSTDSGFVVIADSRVCARSYGNRILNSLPSKNVKVVPSSEIIAEIVSRETLGGE